MYVPCQSWMECVRHHFAPQNPLVLSDLAIRMLSPVSTIWTSFYATFLPHVFLVLHVLLCAWPYILSNHEARWFSLEQNSVVVVDNCSRENQLTSRSIQQNETSTQNSE